jgi:hypothetical protein
VSLHARVANASEVVAGGRVVSFHVGGYRMVDRAESQYDSRTVDVEGHVPLGGVWSFVGSVGAAGELAGGRGSCLGEQSDRVGVSAASRLVVPWVAIRADAGAGVLLARLYGSLPGSSGNADLAWGDRALPEAWASLGLAVALSAHTLASIDARSQLVPRATFRADHVPAGTPSLFYPAFLRDHDLSSYGAAVGLAQEF